MWVDVRIDGVFWYRGEAHECQMSGGEHLQDVMSASSTPWIVTEFFQHLPGSSTGSLYWARSRDGSPVCPFMYLNKFET